MSFKKNYIGKGKEVFKDIVKVVIPASELKNCIFESNGIKYVSFEVAKMKEADKYGKTHTCYYSTKEEDDLPY
jgi:hypothetical protein